MTDATTPGPLLLCIDLQPTFLDVMPDRGRLVNRCSFAIEAAQALGLPVAFTEQVPQKLGSTEPALLALASRPLQLAKTTFSALADHGIRDALLQGQHADHLLICGLETPVCIYQTAIDALRSDIPVTLLSDCLGARRPDDAAVAIDALQRAGVNVLPSETVFYSMMGDAAHPAFRSFTKLVKSHA